MSPFASSEAEIELVRKEFGLDDKGIKETIKKLQEWLVLQPHLPNEEEDGRLERWLIRCKNNIQKTKETIDMYYTAKIIAPEMMSNWDPNTQWFENIANLGYIVGMPGLTADGDRVTVMGLTTDDASGFNVVDFCKAGLMFHEVKLCEDYYVRDVLILDCKNLTFAHLKKISVMILKKYILCVLKGYRSRIRCIHFLNSPSAIDVLVTLVRPLLSKKILSRFHFHGPDLTELHKQVPRRYLPSELGGESGSVNDLFALVVQHIRSYRDWFLSREELKTDESKRPKGQSAWNDTFGIEGSFTRLEID